VANLLYRAQVEPQVRLAAPEISSTSGPTDTAGTGAAGTAVAAAAAGRAARASRPQRQFAATGVVSSAAMEELEDEAATAAGVAPTGVVRSSTPISSDDEPGRNDPCPCGSGKKYKKCHGRLA
jgi:hypothetical protein